MTYSIEIRIAKDTEDNKWYYFIDIDGHPDYESYPHGWPTARECFAMAELRLMREASKR